MTCLPSNESQRVVFLLSAEAIDCCLYVYCSAPRRPERSSIRRHKSSTTINSNSSSTEQEQQHFQRRWSFRLPHTMKQPSSSSGQAVSARPPPAQPDSALTSSSLSLLPPPPPSSAPSSAPSSSSSSGLWGGPLKIPDYFRVGDRAKQQEPEDGRLKRFVSHTDLSQAGAQPASFLRTPSSSTSSIPARVSSLMSHSHCLSCVSERCIGPQLLCPQVQAEQPQAAVQCVGILKVPGRRKLSSNNRVEFLDNLQEKEIPGRHA